MKNLILLVSFALSANIAQAQFYRPDSSFGVAGKQLFKPASGNSAFYDVELQSDGKVLSAGSMNNITRDMLVKRHLKNGSADPSFGKAGLAFIDLGGDELINDMAIQSDGKIVFCGSISKEGQVDKLVIGRLQNDGSPDQGFADKGSLVISAINGSAISDASFRNLLIQPDGKILVTGWVYAANTEYRGIVQRYKTNGSLDSTFGNNGSQFIKFTNGSSNYCQAIYQMQDGRILVLGSAYQSSFAHRLMRLKSNGSIDSSFGVNGVRATTLTGFTSVTPEWISELPGGKILTLGYAYTGSVQKIYMTRHLANGQLDAAYGTNGMSTLTLTAKNNFAYNAILHDNGDCSFAAESFTASGSMASIVRLDSLGKPSASFGTNGISSFSLDDEAYGDGIVADNDSVYIVGGINNHEERYYQGYVLKADHLGALLPGFSAAGTSRAGSGISAASANNILPGTNGQVYITGTLSNMDQDQFVAKVDAKGALVKNFGKSGLATFDLKKDETLRDAIQLADGSILMAANSGKQFINFTAPVVTLGGATHYSLSVLDSNGQKGIQKDFTITAGQFPSVKVVRQDNNGKIVALTSSSLPTTSKFFLIRHNADLSIDNTFGTTNSRIEIQGRTTSNFTGLGDMQIAPDNDAVVLNLFSSTFSTPFSNFTLKKYKENGKLDVNFGVAGVYNNADTVGKDPSSAAHLWKFSNGYYIEYIKDGLAKVVHVGFNGFVSTFGTAVLDSVRVTDMKQLPDGSFLILSSKGSEVVLYHYFANGARDLNFNGNGILKNTPFENAKISKGMVINSDLSVVIYHQVNVGADDAYLGLSKFVYGNTSGPTGLDETIKTAEYAVYPNPFIKGFTLDISGMNTPAHDLTFELMDMQGKLLPLRVDYLNDTQAYIESLSELPAGIYILAGTGTKNEVIRIKLIKN
jgi:uncharacterized delta-60 repeat protein